MPIRSPNCLSGTMSLMRGHFLPREQYTPEGRKGLGQGVSSADEIGIAVVIAGDTSKHLCAAAAPIVLTTSGACSGGASAWGWRCVPVDARSRAGPPDYLDLWSLDGTLHHALYAECRKRGDRQTSPTAAIIDSQSVKRAEKSGARIDPKVMTQARGSTAKNGIFSSIRWVCCSTR